jgi:hypothetical protein
MSLSIARLKGYKTFSLFAASDPGQKAFVSPREVFRPSLMLMNTFGDYQSVALTGVFSVSLSGLILILVKGWRVLKWDTFQVLPWTIFSIA